MPEATNLPAVAEPTAVASITEQPCVFGSAAQFELGQRMARALAASDMVPTQYKDKTANCMIALDIALQRRLSPLTVMQNLSIIQGRPAWSASFIIASINASGLFSPLRYEWQGQPGQDAWGCRAVATDLRSGDRVEGTMITIALAKAEGWYARNGSKWQTMPEQMLRYRAGSFFGRIYAGHITLGLPTTDELIDQVPERLTVDVMSGEIARGAEAGNGVQAAAPAAEAPRRQRRRNRDAVDAEVVPPAAAAPAPVAATPAPAPAAAAPLEPPSAVGNEGPIPGPTPGRPRAPEPEIDDPLF